MAHPHDRLLVIPTQQTGSRGAAESWWRRPAGLAAATVGVVCALLVAAVASGGYGDGSAAQMLLSSLGAGGQQTCEAQVEASTRYVRGKRESRESYE